MYYDTDRACAIRSGGGLPSAAETPAKNLDLPPEIVRSYADGLPGKLDEMHELVVSCQYDKLAKSVHRTAGTCGLYGFTALAAALSALFHAVLLGSTEVIRECYTAARTMCRVEVEGADLA